MTGLESLSIKLSPEEEEILEGRQGATRQQIMKTIVIYGEALKAERLVKITGKGHFVISHCIPGISPNMAMLDELVAAKLKTRYPFTLDPAAPLDYENWRLSSDQIEGLDRIYRAQKNYDEKMLQLGLWSPKAYTCMKWVL